MIRIVGLGFGFGDQSQGVVDDQMDVGRQLDDVGRIGRGDRIARV